MRKRVDQPRRIAKRTKLTKQQFKQLTGTAEAKRYTWDPEQGLFVLSLTRIRGIAAAKQRARKYVIYTDEIGRRLYIGNEDLGFVERGELPITFDLEQAALYTQGFDNPSIKLQYWKKATKFKNLRTKIV